MVPKAEVTPVVPKSAVPKEATAKPVEAAKTVIKDEAKVIRDAGEIVANENPVNPRILRGEG